MAPVLTGGYYVRQFARISPAGDTLPDAYFMYICPSSLKGQFQQVFFVKLDINISTIRNRDKLLFDDILPAEYVIS